MAPTVSLLEGIWQFFWTYRSVWKRDFNFTFFMLCFDASPVCSLQNYLIFWSHCFYLIWISVFWEIHFFVYIFIMRIRRILTATLFFWTYRSVWKHDFNFTFFILCFDASPVCSLQNYLIFWSHCFYFDLDLCFLRNPLFCLHFHRENQKNIKCYIVVKDIYCKFVQQQNHCSLLKSLFILVQIMLGHHMYRSFA